MSSLFWWCCSPNTIGLFCDIELTDNNELQISTIALRNYIYADACTGGGIVMISFVLFPLPWRQEKKTPCLERLYIFMFTLEIRMKDAIYDKHILGSFCQPHFLRILDMPLSLLRCQHSSLYPLKSWIYYVFISTVGFYLLLD